MTDNIYYIVLDCESTIDGELLVQTKYQNLTPPQAITAEKQRIQEQSNQQSDFIPVTYHLPIAVCVALLDKNYNIINYCLFAYPKHDSASIAKNFWQLIHKYHDCAQIVTFNGRSFDLPLMELAAYRYGIQLPEYYFEITRNRYKTGHLDLMDVMSNFGAIKMSGGLDLLTKIIGQKGKQSVSGKDVYDLHENSKHDEVNMYCLSDVRSTYTVLLRYAVIRGEITTEREQLLLGKLGNVRQESTAAIT